MNIDAPKCVSGKPPNKTANRPKYAHDYYLANRDKIIKYRRDRHADRDDVRAKAREYYELNKVHINAERRRRHIEVRYGLTLGAFDAMLESQNGCCAICHSDSPGKTTWYVDHDHITGRLRGLLCNLCNSGLGYFRDNQDFLLSAVEYLRRNQ